MIFTKREKLAVIKNADVNMTISFEDMSALLCESPSNMLYCCDDDDKLVGIISMGDISRARAEGSDRGFSFEKT